MQRISKKEKITKIRKKFNGKILKRLLTKKKKKILEIYVNKWFYHSFLYFKKDECFYKIINQNFKFWEK